MTAKGFVSVKDTRDVVGEEYWAKKGDVDLFLYRKTAPGAAASGPRPVLFLVHGSSQAARTSYDLQGPGDDEYSVMNVFAKWGYDVWTMDHEGYGRSSRTPGFSYILDGAEDLKAAMPIVRKATGQSRFNFFGTSSGALRAGAFCNAAPQWVERLALAAFPWTGKDAPSLIKRRERLAEWQATNRREVGEQYFLNMFTRDVVGLTATDLPAAAAKAEMANGGGSVPNGTYVDMCINLPLVDPIRITCPVLIIRGDHDGITTDADNAAFYAALPTKDKVIVTLSGQAHNMTVGLNRHRFWHVLRSFLEMPERVDGGVA